MSITTYQHLLILLWAVRLDLAFLIFQVKLPSEEEVKAFATTDKIEYLTAIGDQFTIGMMLKAQASIRQQAPWLSLNIDTLGNLTAEEMEDRLKDVAKVRGRTIRYFRHD